MGEKSDQMKGRVKEAVGDLTTMSVNDQGFVVRSGWVHDDSDRRADPHAQIALSEDHVDWPQARLSMPAERVVGQRVRPGGGGTPPAVDAQTWELHVRYARHRRSDDREALVGTYLGHARGLARRMYREREPLDDLEQVAFEGLLLAVDRFDPNRRMPFLGYATPTILGCLKRFYRDMGWGMRVPRWVHELTPSLRDAWEQLSQDLGRTPTIAEVADLLGLQEDDVRSAMGAESARTTLSFDAPATEQHPVPAESAVGDDDPGIDLVVNLQAVQQVVDLLSDDERDLLRLYYEESRTQSEIGGLLGVSQMQVSRSLDRVLRQVRSHLPAGLT